MCMIAIYILTVYFRKWYFLALYIRTCIAVGDHLWQGGPTVLTLRCLAEPLKAPWLVRLDHLRHGPSAVWQITFNLSSYSWRGWHFPPSIKRSRLHTFCSPIDVSPVKDKVLSMKFQEWQLILCLTSWLRNHENHFPHNFVHTVPQTSSSSEDTSTSYTQHKN